MFKKFIHFIKYNNAMTLILVLVFVVGSGVFAQTETGQEVIGQKKTGVLGIDNTLLIEADLDAFDMNFRIEKIEEDEKYYYVTYTFLDLVEDRQAWQYFLEERVRKISKKSRVDLSEYLAEEFVEMYESRIGYLQEERSRAEILGEEKRMETSEYSGLIGKTLDVVASVFSNYRPVKVKELPSPTVSPAMLPVGKIASSSDESLAVADSMTNVYESYMDRKDPDRDNVFGILDNCPDVYNPEQVDMDDDGVGDACEIPIILNEAEQSEESHDDSGDVSSKESFADAQEDSGNDNADDNSDVILNDSEESLDSSDDGGILRSTQDDSESGSSSEETQGEPTSESGIEEVQPEPEAEIEETQPEPEEEQLEVVDEERDVVIVEL